MIDDIRAPDRATLDLYCDRVACAVGRLSVRVFGMERDAGLALAHHLGRALQLTNILRDLDEDAGLGRLYLPREELQASGITATDPAAVVAHPAITKPCAAMVAVAQAEFQKSSAIMAQSPRRVVRAPRIMRRGPRPYPRDVADPRGFAPPPWAHPYLPLRKCPAPFIVLRNLL